MMLWEENLYKSHRGVSCRYLQKIEQWMKTLSELLSYWCVSKGKSCESRHSQWTQCVFISSSSSISSVSRNNIFNAFICFQWMFFVLSLKSSPVLQLFSKSNNSVGVVYICLNIQIHVKWHVGVSWTHLTETNHWIDFNGSKTSHRNQTDSVCGWFQFRLCRSRF